MDENDIESDSKAFHVIESANDDITVSELIAHILTSIKSTSQSICAQEMSVIDQILPTSQSASDRLKGVHVFHMFIEELLGRDWTVMRSVSPLTSSGCENDHKSSLTSLIFHQTVSEEFPAYTFKQQDQAHSRDNGTLVMKLWLSILAVMIVNALSIFTVYLMLDHHVSTVSRSLQYSVIIGWICFEVLTFETLICLACHYYLPLLIRCEVQEIDRVMKEVIQQVVKVLTNQCERYLLINASAHCMVSYQVAQSYPHLIESMIISAYMTYLPGTLYRKWIMSSSCCKASAVIESRDAKDREEEQVVKNRSDCSVRSMRSNHSSSNNSSGSNRVVMKHAKTISNRA
jgi:hypothetical protein